VFRFSGLIFFRSFFCPVPPHKPPRPTFLQGCPIPPTPPTPTLTTATMVSLTFTPPPLHCRINFEALLRLPPSAFFSPFTLLLADCDCRGAFFYKLRDLPLPRRLKIRRPFLAVFPPMAPAKPLMRTPSDRPLNSQKSSSSDPPQGEHLPLTHRLYLTTLVSSPSSPTTASRRTFSCTFLIFVQAIPFRQTSSFNRSILSCRRTKRTLHPRDVSRFISQIALMCQNLL